ncbi:MAG: RNA polymerase sigma factor [Acidobacteriota bacterium]|nr:RNA polymerase sigma factor [Acidobacteriota bacterium]
MPCTLTMEYAATSESRVRTEQGVAGAVADFDAVVSLYRPKIFRFALASLRDDDAAATVTQDCFMKAYHARERFRGDCSMDTWLMRIAVNLIRDHVRNRRLQFWNRTKLTGTPVEELHDFIDDRQRSPEARSLQKEQVQAIWKTAATLPLQQRTVFLLRFVEDMDLLEIAEVTGLKEGTVKAHLFRALRSVRERLGAAK